MRAVQSSISEALGKLYLPKQSVGGREQKELAGVPSTWKNAAKEESTTEVPKKSTQLSTKIKA